ncbi:MAG: Cys-tRNA(Pro) deacylase YbaK [uncultured Acidimicrobiales bacterium]|uniref:Cys-tRNA(Pro)/Cys-tRNA(Cys) deacylase n=1 Tax=uncultured Acidimicrobiales bacterium TaxID=310071 RepID=A0A6J4ILN1_9ACTN|nr:MAG: Cys-tRNA(Pro) deacylase YbaK [uncultured Acidimicrobiales bacterium]
MAARTGASSATPAVALARKEGIEHAVHRYVTDREGGGGEDEGYGLEAAAALGVGVDRVLKTLVAATGGGQLVVGVVPVSRMLDLRALAASVGSKRAAMADAAAAERATGYVLGGISPLGQRRRLPTVVDQGAMEHPTVFVSAGRRGLEIELDPRDLVRLAQATVAAIAGRAPAAGRVRRPGAVPDRITP